MSKKASLFWGVASTAALLTLPGLYNGLTVRRYTLRSPKLTGHFRIALVADFHCCKYGNRQRQLLDAIHAQRPDLVAIAGDLFDHLQDIRNAEWLLEGLVGRYPCYYVTGNHEYYGNENTLAWDVATLKRYGVRRLSGEAETVTLKGQTVDICGVDDPLGHRLETLRQGKADTFFQQLAFLGERLRDDRYTILLSHRPEAFPFYARYGFDLTLCGHAHGGQWRIPGLLNGVFAPNQGLFPKYAGGEYRQGKSVMIVSRGLARETTRIPRFYDPPELVIIDFREGSVQDGGVAGPCLPVPGGADH